MTDDRLGINSEREGASGPSVSLRADRRFIRRLYVVVEQRSRLLVAAAILLVLVSGTAYSLHLGNATRFPDESDYLRLAQHVAESARYTVDGEHLTAFRPPGYPLFLSVLVACGADVVHMRVANFLALGASMYLLHRLLSRHCSTVAGVVGVVLVMCYPVLFYSAGTLYPQTLIGLLLLIVVALLTRPKLRYHTGVGLGLVWGYLILVAPFFALMLPLCLAWRVLSYGVRGVGCLVLVAVIAALPAAVWSARNYRVFGAFAFVSSNSGLNLLFGNCPDTTAYTGATIDTSVYEREAAHMGLNEAERDALFRAKAVEYMKSHKVQTAIRYVQKLLHHFHYRNTLGAKAESSEVKDLIMLVTYGPLLLLFVVRVCALGALRPTHLEVLFILVYLASALVYAFFFTRIRLRLPFDMLMIGVVASFVGHACRRVLTRA